MQNFLLYAELSLITGEFTFESKCLYFRQAYVQTVRYRNMLSKKKRKREEAKPFRFKYDMINKVYQKKYYIIQSGRIIYTKWFSFHSMSVPLKRLPQNLSILNITF